HRHALRNYSAADGPRRWANGSRNLAVTRLASVALRQLREVDLIEGEADERAAAHLPVAGLFELGDLLVEAPEVLFVHRDADHLVVVGLGRLGPRLLRSRGRGRRGVAIEGAAQNRLDLVAL